MTKENKPFPFGDLSKSETIDQPSYATYQEILIVLACLSFFPLVYLLGSAILHAMN